MREKAILFGLSAVSLFLGTVYSIYNTDPHHWGFILSTALDFIRGKALFSEIYIQYGAGQPLLFKLLSYAVPINYTTIGIIASVIYALNFPVLFASIKRIAGGTHAILITAIAFLVHPFAIYPWPDYFAGLCISLSTFFLIKGKQAGGDFRFAISGSLLFLAFLFRNTYLVGIGATIVAYVCLALTFRQIRERAVYRVSGIFAGLFALYMAFLSIQGNVGHWYVQNFGAATGAYGVGTGSAISMIKNFIVVGNLTVVFVGLLLVNAYMIVLVLARKGTIRDEASGSTSGLILFLCLLGCSGMAQAVYIFEIFRMQNSASPLYLGLAYFFSSGIPSGIRVTHRRYLSLSFAVLIGLLIAALPYALTGSRRTSAIWPLVEPSIGGPIESFSSIDIPLFSLHRFQSSEKKYYQDLRRHICDGKRKIVNLTGDATIPYLCSEQENALDLPFFSEQFLRRINVREADRVLAGSFRANEVIVADARSPLNRNSSLRLVATIERPSTIRWLSPGAVAIYHVE